MGAEEDFVLTLDNVQAFQATMTALELALKKVCQIASWQCHWRTDSNECSSWLRD